MPATLSPNPEIEVLEQKLKDIDIERLRVHRAYLLAHETLHNSEDMIRDLDSTRNSLDADSVREFRDNRKRAAQWMKTHREAMEVLLSQRIEIKRQIAEIWEKERMERRASENEKAGKKTTRRK